MESAGATGGEKPSMELGEHQGIRVLFDLRASQRGSQSE